MKKFTLLLIFSFFISTGVVFAQSPEEIYRKANINYENEDYEKAVSLYEMLLKIDRVGPEVFYNLGNSYFKLKKIGRAIVNYRRALRLAPGDRDISHNLKLARAMTVDKIERPEKGFLVKALLLPYDSMNIDQLTIFVSMAYLCIVTLLIVSIFFAARRRGLFYAVGTLAAILIVFFIFLASKIRAKNSKEAVVVVDSVDARSGPKEDYLLQFTLHEGSEIRIVEDAQDWREIDLSKDLRGWIPKDSVEAI
ncbi:MAG: tetratricopeptide repeat protein [Candidatus Omnitrophica bacterium]|nr:tetratricopeptide repeat protein [Candidatus Omnitrophota bacterium]MBU4149224.1 tetratricopeptide repeat protein [Candidatus Omnitrophota bacterium]